MLLRLKRLFKNKQVVSGFGLIELLVAVGIMSVTVLVSFSLLKSLSDSTQRFKVISDYEILEKTIELAVVRDSDNCNGVLQAAGGAATFNGTDTNINSIRLDGNTVATVGQDFGSLTLTNLLLREVQPGVGRRTGLVVDSTTYNTYLAQIDIEITPKVQSFYGGGVTTKSILLKIFANASNNVIAYCLDGAGDVQMNFNTVITIRGSGDGGSTTSEGDGYAGDSSS